MSSSGVELDFFTMQNDSISLVSSPPPTNKLFQHARSFRDIQNVVSNISPEVVKTVMARSSLLPTPRDNHNSFPLNVLTARPGCGVEKGVDTLPLTIFYNGTVAVFDVSRDKAEHILKRAEEMVEFKHALSSTDLNLDGDLPIARKKSLQRFLEKRKQRLTTLASPYGYGSSIFSHRLNLQALMSDDDDPQQRPST